MAGNRHEPFLRRGAGWLLLWLAALAGAAQAQGWSGAVGYGSDNVYRGVSLSSGLPAWLADLHYGFGTDWVAGIGVSQERPPFQSSGAQFTLYLDRRWQFDEDWSGKLGLVHYESPWNVWRDELDYNELTAAVGWRGRVRLSVSLSPDTPGIFRRDGAETDAAAAAELSYNQPIHGRLAANAGLGYVTVRNAIRLDPYPDSAGRARPFQRYADLDYTYGSAGLSYGIGDFYVYTSLLWASSGAQRYNTGSPDRTRWVTTFVWSF
jgi:uncharacterized protein (TIGR02001 family)